MPPKQILDYQIQNQIGKGAFSEVYQATKDNKTYAVKLMLPPRGTKSQLIIDSLRFEFWVLKDIDHPNIVKIYDFGALDSGQIFLVEEYLHGTTLEKYCQGKSFSDCETLFKETLSAIATIHDWNITHGDIKPQNIFVIETNAGPQIKLLDFGLAASGRKSKVESQKSSENDQSVLESAIPLSQIRGTPSTMAPEMILDHTGDQKSDIYSLGATFYHCLSGANPFSRKTLDETFQAHLQFTPESIGLKRNDIIPAWDKMILKMLAKNPDERPSSAHHILIQLSEQKFILSQTEFVGRESELQNISHIHDAIKKENKVAIVANGPKGVGANRFLRELFYRTIHKFPQYRDKISFEAKQKSEILLLNRTKAPNDYQSIEIELKPFTKTETAGWLKDIFNINELPNSFLEPIISLTAGNPGKIWDLLNHLNENNLLTDASGQVTKSTLDLIDFAKIFTDTTELNKNFDFLEEQIKDMVRKRQIKPDDEIWETIDQTIETTADKTQRRINRAKMYLIKGANLIDYAKFDEARDSLTTAVEIFRDEDKLLPEKLRTENFLAYISLRQGKPDEAVKKYEDVLKQVKKKLSDNQAHQISNLDLGLAYFHTGQFDKAIERLKEEIEFHKKYSTPTHQISSLYTLALACQSKGNTEQAKDYYNQILDMARKIHNPTFLLRAYNGIGNMLRDSQSWREAVNAYSEALEVALAIKDLTSAAATAQNLGGLKGDHGFHKEAITDLEDSLKYAEKISPKYGFEKTLICRALEQLGDLYSKLGQNDLAIDYLDRAWHMAQADPDLENFRFWILASRCRHFIRTQDNKKFHDDLSQLNFYAKDDQQKQIKDGIKQDFDSEKIPTASERETRLQKELKTILNINKDLVGEETTLDELFKKILGYAIELSHSELGVILLADEQGILTPKLSLNAELDEDLSDISLSVANKVLKSGQIIKTADAGEDQDFNQYASVMALNLKSILGIPITFKGKVLGVLYLSHRYRVGAYNQNITETVKTFADQAGLAIKNHQLLEFHKRMSEELKEDLEESEMNLTLAEEQLKQLPTYLKNKYAKSNIITNSPNMLDLLEKCEKVAKSTISLVIHGESGTGKEVVSRFIHDRSQRKRGPFIAINCGALPANLVESELFGHKRGAFTGADRDKTGLVEAANGGTLFLDEITDLPLEVQVKLLRVLQEREVVRLGDTKPKSVDIRVLAASHKNLKDAVSDGRFREDLFYRIAGMEVHIPPLRDRREDIPLLAEHFLNMYREENDKKYPESIHSSLTKLMMAYHWPGNIRELKNFMEVGVSLTTSKVLKKEVLPDYLLEKMQLTIPIKRREGGETETAVGWYDPRKTWREHELLIYASALVKYDFDVQKTANNLGVGIATVYKWLREHRIKETKTQWENVVLPYEDDLKLGDIRAHVFQLASKRHPGHPYLAAKELDVAPVTFYRWSKD